MPVSVRYSGTLVDCIWTNFGPTLLFFHFLWVQERMGGNKDSRWSTLVLSVERCVPEVLMMLGPEKGWGYQGLLKAKTLFPFNPTSERMSEPGNYSMVIII